MLLRTIPVTAGAVPAAPALASDYSWYTAQMPLGPVVEVVAVAPGRSGFVLNHSGNTTEVSVIASDAWTDAQLAQALLARLERILESEALLKSAVPNIRIRDAMIGIGVGLAVRLDLLSVEVLPGSASTIALQAATAPGLARQTEDLPRTVVVWQTMVGDVVSDLLTGTINTRIVQADPRHDVVMATTEALSPGQPSSAVMASNGSTMITAEVVDAVGLDPTVTHLRAVAISSRAG